MCCDADKLVPNMTYGLPLTPQADTCRTARHALTLIATARPAAFITTMAREVARYNTLQQNAQTLNVNMGASVLVRAKPEILRIVEQLIDKMQSEMSDLLVEVRKIIPINTNFVYYHLFNILIIYIYIGRSWILFYIVWIQVILKLNH